MKKVLCCMLAFILTLGVCPAFTEGVITGTWYGLEWSLDGDTLYLGGEGDTEVPSYIPLSGVYSYMTNNYLGGEHSGKIKKIVFHDGIIKIGACTAGLSNLEEVVIPASVSEMTLDSVRYVVSEDNKAYSSENYVLFNKDKTELLKYGESVEGEEYVVPETVTKIWSTAFSRNPFVKKVVLGSNCIEIGQWAFNECESLESVDLKNVQIIGKEAFYESGLKSVVIPATATSIDEGAFKNCRELESAVVEYGIKEIAKECFSGCVKLESVILPEGIVGISDDAFKKTNLPKENGCVYIGEYLISHEGEGEVVIKNGTTHIAKYAFEDSNATRIVVPESMSVINKYAFLGANKLESVVLPESIAEIQSGAFSGTGLKSIDIGKNVTVLDPLFTNCDNLQSINVSEENSVYSSSDGVLFNKDKTELLKYPAGKLDEEYIVPDGVVSLGGFGPNKTLKKVIIPDSVVELKERAFSGCNSLYEVQLGNSVEIIGDSAFYSCKSLKKINFPEKLRIIGGSALAFTVIEEAVLPDSLEEIGGMAFYECRWLHTISFGAGLKRVGNSAFGFCSALLNIKLPDGVESVGDSCFQGCGLIKEVYIGGGEMGEFVFVMDVSLERVVLGDNVKNIAVKMFEGCTSLVSVDVGDGVEIIGVNAFQNCQNLETIHLGKNVKTINARFYSSKKLREITLSEENESFVLVDGVLFTSDMETLVKYPPLKEGREYVVPEGVKVIMPNAFQNCIYLEKITLPDTLEVIMDQAFQLVPNVTEFILPKSLKEIGYDAIHITGMTACYYKGSEEDWDNIKKVRFDDCDYKKVDINFNFVDIAVTVNGQAVDCAAYSQRPYIKNDRTMVPMRAIFEALGASVSWDDNTKTAIAVKDGTEIRITIGENAIYKNGEKIIIDTSAEIRSGRTMVPVRAISEAFDCIVEWDNLTITVVITY